MKVIILLFSLSICLFANEFAFLLGKKDFSDSQFKKDGDVHHFHLKTGTKEDGFELCYTKDNVNLENHPKIKKTEFRRYSFVSHIQIDNFVVTGNFIKLQHSHAPVDNGNIYGLQLLYPIQKSFSILGDIYKSDYETFDVNQYVVGLIKKFKFDTLKISFKLEQYFINIDGEKYESTKFQEKNYQTIGLKCNLNYNDYFALLGTLQGKRMFSVYERGMIVQSDLIEQDKLYYLRVGKSFNTIKLFIQYMTQEGQSVGTNQTKEKLDLTAIGMMYNF